MTKQYQAASHTPELLLEISQYLPTFHRDGTVSIPKGYTFQVDDEAYTVSWDCVMKSLDALEDRMDALLKDD